MDSRSFAEKPQSSAVSERKHVPAYEFMAASIGDIQWLNQTFTSIQDEHGKENVVTFDKHVSFCVPYFIDNRSVNVKVVVMDA